MSPSPQQRFEIARFRKQEPSFATGAVLHRQQSTSVMLEDAAHKEKKATMSVDPESDTTFLLPSQPRVSLDATGPPNTAVNTSLFFPYLKMTPVFFCGFSVLVAMLLAIATGGYPSFLPATLTGTGMVLRDLPAQFSSMGVSAPNSGPTNTLAEYDSITHNISIVSTLTSPTFTELRTRVDIGWWMRLLGKSQRLPRTPATVLMRDRYLPKECWPLRGSAGFVGINLGRDVYIVNITIGHHLDIRSLSPSAPQHVAIWGIPIPSAPMVGERESALPWPSASGLSQALQGIVPVFLGRLQYDIHSGVAAQDFCIRSNITESIAFNQVIVEILDNWGSERFTCLYGVRVRGFINGR
ncbi:hypothetical protein C8Q74DRAFT_1373466 [Fomes fomentarius]|nr:hypothetical protein C8Q74DRAFT_1373466 [Fomes fomentarius]